MTSRTSSKPGSARSDHVRFPPRSALPPGVTIERLPLLGTSWYERGVIYWARRTGIGLLFALVVVVYVAAIEGVLGDISQPGTGLYDGLAAAEVVFTIVTGVLIFRRSWRNSLDGKGATRRDTKAAGRAGAGLGSLAFTTGGVLAGLLVFSSLLTSGLFLAVFVTWLVPTPPAEQYARRVMAGRIRVGHDVQQINTHSTHYGSKNHHKH